MFQVEEQDKTPERNPNEMEINNLPDKEFKVIVINMLPELWRKMEKHSENFNKDLENKRKNQSELKNTIIETKNTPWGINSILDNKEE